MVANEFTVDLNKALVFQVDLNCSFSFLVKSHVHNSTCLSQISMTNGYRPCIVDFLIIDDIF